LVGATATSSVDILLWSRPGKNFQFGVPQTEFLNYSVPLAASTVPLGTITYQGGLGPIGNDDFQTVEHELVPSSGDFATSELMWGETIKSVRMLMQKPVLLSMGVKTAGTGTDTPLSQLLFLHKPLNKNYRLTHPATFANQYMFDQFFDLSQHCMLMFLGIATSMRYKVLPMDPVNFDWAATSITHFPSDNYSYTATDQRHFGTETFGWLSKENSVETTVPYYGAFKYEIVDLMPFHTSTNFQPDPRGNLRFDLLRTSDAALGTHADVYYNVARCCGPDLRLGVFRGTPLIVLVSETLEHQSYFDIPTVA